jgi:uroporphyrinogen-III synthase
MNRWVLITRPQEEARPLAEALAASEIHLVAYPVLREVAVDDQQAWDHVVQHRQRIAALFVTSPRAPRHFRRAGQQLGVWSALAAVPADAVGGTTAAACREIGLKVRHEGAAGAVALAAEVAKCLRPGDVVLHPSGCHHREEAYTVFAAAGAEVLPVAVYDMEESAPELLPALPATPPLAVLLTSPRAAAAYARGAPSHFRSAPHFALGGTTAEAAARLGIVTRMLPHPDPLLLMEELCPT